MSSPTTLSSGTTDVPRAESAFVAPLAALSHVFGRRPLILGESAESYDELVARVTLALEPMDMIEEIATRDFADLTWDIQRLKRLKEKLLLAGMHACLVDALKGARTLKNNHRIDHAAAKKWAAACLRSEADAIAEVVMMLRAIALDWDAIAARAHFDRIDDFERIDLQIAAAETRRAKFMADTDRRREVVGRRMQRISGDVVQQLPDATPLSA